MTHPALRRCRAAVEIASGASRRLARWAGGAREQVPVAVEQHDLAVLGDPDAAEKCVEPGETEVHGQNSLHLSVSILHRHRRGGALDTFGEGVRRHPDQAVGGRHCTPVPLACAWVVGLGQGRCPDEGRAGVGPVLARHTTVDARVRQVEDDLIAPDSVRADETRCRGFGIADPRDIWVGLECTGETPGDAHRVVHSVEAGFDAITLDPQHLRRRPRHPGDLANRGIRDLIQVLALQGIDAPGATREPVREQQPARDDEQADDGDDDGHAKRDSSGRRVHAGESSGHARASLLAVYRVNPHRTAPLKSFPRGQSARGPLDARPETFEPERFWQVRPCLRV
jgi:hypothetical protein